MGLKLFEFTQQVLEELDNAREELEVASNDLKVLFKEILSEKSEAYIHIKSRVKSAKSLKEKILRYDYYNQYGSKQKLFENISDLIGIRIECRFIDDEQEIYRYIRKYFNEASDEYQGYYYNKDNPSILLELSSKQPKEQKNGFKLYRIDAKYITGLRCINFEIQIKSLVNVFWSEIEHKVIYKNYDYIIGDRFYKEIMKSIKSSLTSIDNQLFLISNQFDSTKNRGIDESEEELKKLLSKIVYDIFARRMKDSIGILIDFKESCDAIIRYVMSKSNDDKSNINSNKMVMVLERLREIDSQCIEFNEEIVFGRKLKFNNKFETLIGKFIVKTINKEFQWNLFFRILFQVEPYENEEDFERFIAFYHKRICDKINANKLKVNYTEQESNKVINEFLVEFAELFIRFNDVSLLYEHNIENVSKIANSILDAMSRNEISYDKWKEKRQLYLEFFRLRVLTTLEAYIEPRKVLDFLDKVRDSGDKLDIPKGLLKYIDKL